MRADAALVQGLSNLQKGHQHVRVLLGRSVGRVNGTKTRVVPGEINDE